MNKNSSPTLQTHSWDITKLQIRIFPIPLNGLCTLCLDHKLMGENLVLNLCYSPQTRLVSGIASSFFYVVLKPLISLCCYLTGEKLKSWRGTETPTEGTSRNWKVTTSWGKKKVHTYIPFDKGGPIWQHYSWWHKPPNIYRKEKILQVFSRCFFFWCTLYF